MFSQSGTPSNESGMMEEGSVTPATRLGQIPATSTPASATSMSASANSMSAPPAVKPRRHPNIARILIPSANPSAFASPLGEYKGSNTNPAVSFSAMSLSLADGGSENVGSNSVPALLMGSPYAKGFTKIKSHALHSRIKQLLTSDGQKVTLDYAHEHIQKYTNQIGNVSSDANLLIEETEPTVQIAQRLTQYINLQNEKYKQAENDAYKAKNDGKDLYDELRNVSVTGVQIRGEMYHFISISGTHTRDGAKQLLKYINEFIGKDKNILLFPSISPQFKSLVDYFGQSEFAIPNYLESKHCAEFSYLANLAKLFYINGKDMFITGIVNVPVLSTHKRIKPPVNINQTDEQRLSMYDVGTPWVVNEVLMHHWRCCDNCKNNKPLYLFMLGVMQDLGGKKLKVDTGLALDAGSDEELTSPVHARIAKLMEELEKREAVANAKKQNASAASASVASVASVSASAAASVSAAAASGVTLSSIASPSAQSSVATEQEILELQKLKSKSKHFDFAATCSTAARTSPGNSPHAFYTPAPKQIAVVDPVDDTALSFSFSMTNGKQ
jgi:hypothetical protein